MATRRFYIGVENLALTGPQKQTFIDALKQLGANNDPSPARRNHWRTRLDNDAVIFEAEFDDTHFTVAALRQRLANIFSVAVAQITNTTSNPAVGTLLTLSYQATPRLRVLLFGGANATYAESHAAVLQYLADNRAAWDEQI